MEKDYCNFSDLEPMEKIMYYNSLYMFLSQLNINTPGFAKKYIEMFNSDHDTEENTKEMRQKEEYILNKLGITRE